MPFIGMPLVNPDDIFHYGVKGMKWGVRRYRNYDGTLTEAGKHRYYSSEGVRADFNSDTGYYEVRRKGSNEAVDIEKDTFESFEKSIQGKVVENVSRALGISTKLMESYIDSYPEISDYINREIDGEMGKTLSKALSAAKSNKRDEGAQGSSNHGGSHRSNSGHSKSANSKPKYTQEEAMAKGYEDLEKKYPNFYKMSQDKQDQLWMDYMNESGLYRYL